MDHSSSFDTPDPSYAELIAARPSLDMHAHDGLLMDGVPLAAIADAVGTPSWVYSAATITRRARRLREALAPIGAHIHYAVKANDHLAVLGLLAAEGCGADVVSAGELARARRAGIDPADIVFSGVGKTNGELREALGCGVGQINVESAEELDMLSAVASSMGATARIALRVNPDVDAGTHAKITTGKAENKFGIPYRDAVNLALRASSLPGIQFRGIALHIGSQILSMTPYRAAYARAAELVGILRRQGLVIDVVDCGGGLGIPYRDEPAAAPEALAGAIKAELGGLNLKLMVEPGRWLVGPAGILLTSVVLVKFTGERRFVVLDAAMNDLIRPSLYEAWHGILPVSPVDAVAPQVLADVVGPVCESGDTFARGRSLPAFRPDARVAILDTGAYGAVMSSTYNARPLAAQVLVADGGWKLIRPRQSIEDLWRDEIVPAPQG